MKDQVFALRIGRFLNGKVLTENRYSVNYDPDESVRAGRGFPTTWSARGKVLVISTDRRVLGINASTKLLWQWTPQLTKTTMVVDVNLVSDQAYALTLDTANAAVSEYRLLAAMPVITAAGGPLTFVDQVLRTGNLPMQVLGRDVTRLAIAEMKRGAEGFDIVVLSASDTSRIEKRLPIKAYLKDATPKGEAIVLTVADQGQISKIMFDWATLTVKPTT